MLKYVLRAVYGLFLGRLWWRQSQDISSMSETRGGGLIRDQFPPNTTRAREPAPLRAKHNYRAVHLLVNYMFNLYF